MKLYGVIGAANYAKVINGHRVLSTTEFFRQKRRNAVSALPLVTQRRENASKKYSYGRCSAILDTSAEVFH